MPRRSSSRSAAWVAANRVQVDRNERVLSLLVPINEDWDPDQEQDYPGGVPEDDPHQQIAERAITLRLCQELAGRLTLRAWVAGERAARGGGGRGMARLAADLLGLSAIPKRVRGLARGKQSAEWRRYDAELRKLEEYAQGKYTAAAGARRARIAALGGPGNPYTAAAKPLGDLLEPLTVTLGARADWRISDDFMPFTLKHAPPEQLWGPAHDVLTKGGAGLLDIMIVLLNTHLASELLIDASDHEGHVYSLAIQARTR